MSDSSNNSPDINAARNTGLPEIERWRELFQEVNNDRLFEQRWKEDTLLLFRKLGEPKSKSNKGVGKDDRNSILQEDFATLMDHEEFVKRMEAEVLATDWMFSTPSSQSANK